MIFLFKSSCDNSLKFYAIFYAKKSINKSFIPEFFNTPAFLLQNNLCELTAQEHKFQKWFCIQKPVLILKISGFQNIFDSDLVW